MKKSLLLGLFLAAGFTAVNAQSVKPKKGKKEHVQEVKKEVEKPVSGFEQPVEVPQTPNAPQVPEVKKEEPIGEPKKVEEKLSPKK